MRQEVPQIYQHLYNTVFPERQTNADPKLRKYWWLFRRSNEQVRGAIAGLSRYIVTVETSKFRTFSFLPAATKPEHKLVVIGSDDALIHGILNSRVHVVFALSRRAKRGETPVYAKTDCFDPFPFPLCGEAERNSIREVAEEIDAHRKRAQSRYGLTLTGLYNVLERLRANEQLTDKEKLIHDNGLVSVLKQLHDELDAAVFAAYGWPANLTDADILDRLVALNAERAAEEARGVIHWLRPDYQAKGQTLPVELPFTSGQKRPKAKLEPAKRKTKLEWPKALAERVRAVETALHQTGGSITPATLAQQFARAKPADVLEILKTLETLGRAHANVNGEFRP